MKTYRSVMLDGIFIHSVLEPSAKCRFTHSALRRFLSSWLCGGSKCRY